MRLRKPVVALSTAALLGLAACGGGGGSSSSQGNSKVDTSKLAASSSGKDPSRQGPVTIAGAKKGGTVNVLSLQGFTTSIDPSDLYYTDVSEFGSGLLFRSLTQYAYDPKTGSQILIPDLATDLGTPNKDFTQWTFTIRSGIKYDNGQPVTAKDVAYGIARSMDEKAFPDGAGLYYSNPYFLGGDTYKGPFTGHDPTGTAQKAVTASGNKVIIKMAKPFPDFPYYGTFPSMGPIPQGHDNPATYGQHPWATGPYKIQSYTRGKSLVLVKNKYWDPKTDPGRTQYPDGWNIKSGVQSDQIDQIMLNDSGPGQTSLTTTDIQAKDYRQMQQSAPDRLTVGPSPCTFYAAPDNRKITDLKVREALLYAYPYKDVILAGGLIPGVTAIPANSLMAPGVAGRQDYKLFGHQDFQTDAAKAKQLLKSSGNLGYQIKFAWRTDNDINTKQKDVLIRALTAAGFKATPVATTEANFDHDVIQNINWPGNFRSGTGWCQDWPSGSTWVPPVLGTVDWKKLNSPGTNYAFFSQPSVDARIKQIGTLPVSQQPAAWGALDKEIMTKYLPIIPQYYSGDAYAHGSKIMGMNLDTNLGEPTVKDIWIK